MSGLQRIKAFLYTTTDILKENNFTLGCPIGNLSLEMGDINEKFRLKLSDAFSKMEEKIFECLKDAQSVKEINQSIDIRTSAAFIINSWEGAIVRAKAEKSNSPLKILEEMLFGKILIK
ncbi:MAG: TetR family transcriptional regulator C-terminal domain-containing protein [Ignavibacteriales bacterium]|nr:TetR family transcriptional regulator C-terminal domain-containing protein [Ignavibacteriales bacterium]